ncbi:MAG: exodeoxyribonuclease V subunit gamma, partial [Peptococcaceae bacterium]|nr:exodeoxyribonuclease V subunit gamma [Peptococcaceae bacterium]
MTLRFIIGRAGTGKTRACLNAVREELLIRPAGPPLILLVPEQATFQTEYALAATPGLKGFIRAQVLSFRRLAYRVLQEAGGAARAHIGELGKRMVLRRLLERRKGELKVFQRSAGQPGFADTLARTLGEMKTYCIGPAELAAAASSLRGREGGALADKLDDLYLLYCDLENYLADRFTDPDDYLSLLADRLGKSAAVQGAEVWVDGFTGFTPQEYRVLAALLQAARRVNVSLCVDAGSIQGVAAESDPFYPVWETYEQLCLMAAGERVPVERPVVLGNPARRFRSDALRQIERCFFQRPAEPLPGSRPEVVLAYAANRSAEVEGAAREIIRLARDEGYRWREIVVLARDLPLYAGLVANVFADYAIPAFIDQKRPATHHALLELVRSAIEVAVRDWPYDAVFRYLKTDLTPLSREEVDILENYVLAHGIRGSRWTDGRPWTYRLRRFPGEEAGWTQVDDPAQEESELAEVNRIRACAAVSLGRFCTRVRGAAGAREITAVLYDLLDELAVPAQLERWSAAAEVEGALEEAREHGQVWNAFTALLDELVEVLGDDPIPLEEYAAVLDEGLSHLSLSLIPPGLDQVTVGSLDRSRSPGARAAFILGVSEGHLPARTTEQGVFTDAEREKLRSGGLKLAPGARRRAFEEQYLVYVALTRSAERLTLSCPLADDDGGAVSPSPVLEQIKAIIPGAGEVLWPIEPGEGVEANLAFVGSPGRTLSRLAARLIPEADADAAHAVGDPFDRRPDWRRRDQTPGRRAAPGADHHFAGQHALAEGAPL